MGMVLYLRRITQGELSAIRENLSAFDEFMFDQDAVDGGDVVDFDKAWHALHFMLTGSAGGTNSPLSLIINEYEKIGGDGEWDEGFSIIPADRLAAFQAEFKLLTDKELSARYSPQAMDDEQVYMADYFVEEGAEGLKYIMQWMPNFRNFLDRCVESGSGAFLLLN
jgi:Domain of unknown function (DUF1877)